MISAIGYDIRGAPQPERVRISDDHNATENNLADRLRLRPNSGKSATGSRRKKARFVGSRHVSSKNVALSVKTTSPLYENHPHETYTSDFASTCTVSGSLAPKRLLMSSWLIMKANDKQIDSICWHDDDRTQIKILWKHASKSNWTTNDSRLFKEWAEYTGKSRGSKNGSKNSEAQSKKWKANFRCALNSLSDVTEVKSLSQKGGSNPYKVYQINRQTKEDAKINPAKTVKRHERSKKCHQAKMKETAQPLERTAAPAPLKLPQHRNAPSVRQRSHYRVSNDVIQRPSVPAEKIPLPVVEYSTSHPLIPTVVEEMSLDDELTDEDSLSDQFDGGTLRSFCSTSPSEESSGYYTDAYLNDIYSEQDQGFEPHVTFLSAELIIEHTTAYQNMFYFDSHVDYEFQLFDSLHVN